MHPVFGRDLPGVDPVVQDGGGRPVCEEPLHLHGKRGVAAVESDHHPLPGLVSRLDDPAKALDIGRKRLFHEDIFSGTQRLDRHRCVEIVPRRDHHRVDIGVVEDPLVVGGAVGKAVLLRDRLRRESRSGRKPPEVHREAGEVRVEGALGVDPGADAPERPGRGRSLPCPRTGLLEADDGTGCVRTVRAVLQENPDEPFLSGVDEVVGPRRLVERERVGDQAVEIDLLLAHQFEERLHVPLLRPPDIDRVVDPPLLVVSVVAAGAVGAGDDDLRLFLVEDVTGHIHADIPDDHDPALAPDQAAGGLDGCARPGGRGDDDRVRPERR